MVRKGSILIELLEVIAVFAILIALLLPAGARPEHQERGARHLGARQVAVPYHSLRTRAMAVGTSDVSHGTTARRHVRFSPARQRRGSATSVRP